MRMRERNKSNAIITAVISKKKPSELSNFRMAERERASEEKNVNKLNRQLIKSDANGAKRSED
jgi:hypothetical protein